MKDFAKMGNSCNKYGRGYKNDLKQNSVALTKQNYDLINDEKIAEKIKARFKNVEKAIKSYQTEILFYQKDHNYDLQENGQNSFYFFKKYHANRP